MDFGNDNPAKLGHMIIIFVVKNKIPEKIR